MGIVSFGRLAGGCSGAEGDDGPAGEHFSFFVTSMAGLLQLSPDVQGFGGDLFYNGQSGVLGADEHCKALAESSMTGAGAKGWKAFLSTTEDAIDRIGGGPWFDRQGPKVADDKSGWAGARGSGGPVPVGPSWPAQSGKGWQRAHAAGGRGRSVKVQQAGAPMRGDFTVGAGGDYGGFYCFASTP